MHLIPRRLLTTAALLTALSTAAVTAQGMDHSMHGLPAAPARPALSALTGRAFDRAFLSMMIPHHQAAVDMARAALPSQDAKVSAWAKAVISDQTEEIRRMTTLLGAYGGADPAAAAQMAGMNRMAAQVKAASQRDVAFVRGMLPHHASAVTMANLALQRAQHPEVLTLARGIITAQATEMLAYRTWLRARGLN